MYHASDESGRGVLTCDQLERDCSSLLLRRTLRSWWASAGQTSNERGRVKMMRIHGMFCDIRSL